MVGSVLLIFLVFCVVLLCVSGFVLISAYKRCAVHLYIQSFVGEHMSYLRYFCLLSQWCSTHIVLCFCFDFRRLMYPSFSELSFCIAPSVFSNINISICYVYYFDLWVIVLQFYFL